MPQCYLLQHYLDAAVRRDPAAVAVVDGDRSMSYGELDLAASRVASLLQTLGVTPGDRVGLYLPKSLEAVTAIYGVLRAGAAYVPLDPDAPPARLGYIAGDAGARVVVSSAARQPKWRVLVSNAGSVRTIVTMTEPVPDAPPAGATVVGPAELAAAPPEPPGIPTISADLAYILYTSGSTGQPKGVMLSHANARAFVDWAVDCFSVTSTDRISSHAPFHFDLSVFDLFGAAAAGAPVVLVPHSVAMFPVEVRRFIDLQRISVWYSVPSALTALVRRGGLEPGDLPTLRTVLFAGEVFPSKHLREIMKVLPHARFANLYGPTETNVCTWYDVTSPPDSDEPIPIGRAIDNDEVFAVTDDGGIAGVGEVGELYVRGATVMQGYWGDAARTDAVLTPNRFRGFLRDPVYRTGDLVRLTTEGDYEFLGRRDAQIKTRGHRVELGDIETALYGHPGVVECAVVAVADDEVTNRLHAFAVAHEGVSRADLVRYLRERVPAYMVPETISLTPALPKTSTGKTDRQRLAHRINEGKTNT